MMTRNTSLWHTKPNFVGHDVTRQKVGIIWICFSRNFFTWTQGIVDLRRHDVGFVTSMWQIRIPLYTLHCWGVRCATAHSKRVVYILIRPRWVAKQSFVSLPGQSWFCAWGYSWFIVRKKYMFPRPDERSFQAAISTIYRDCHRGLRKQDFHFRRNWFHGMINFLSCWISVELSTYGTICDIIEETVGWCTHACIAVAWYRDRGVMRMKGVCDTARGELNNSKKIFNLKMLECKPTRWNVRVKSFLKLHNSCNRDSRILQFHFKDL